MYGIFLCVCVDLIATVSPKFFFLFLETTMSVTATLSSPCSGDQTLNQVNTNLYTGTSGDFTAGVLASDPTLGWVLTIFDYSNTSSPCYPSIQYGQVTPNTSDPSGSYGKLVGGSPDTDEGEASVL